MYSVTIPELKITQSKALTLGVAVAILIATYIIVADVSYATAFAYNAYILASVAAVVLFVSPAGRLLVRYIVYEVKLPIRLPIRMADLEGLPRKLMAGVVTVVMGLVVIVIGIVIFGSATGIAAYIDKIFGDLGVKANITQTVQSLNLGTVFTVIGIVIVIVGFVLILTALIEMGKGAQTLWKE